MIRPFVGRWDVDKRPIAWQYTIQLACSMCRNEAGFIGKAEEGVIPNVGTWRRISAPSRGHSDPLAEDAVVCSRECAEAFVAASLDSLFA